MATTPRLVVPPLASAMLTLLTLLPMPTNVS
jgi:hypothetical protein